MFTISTNKGACFLAVSLLSSFLVCAEQEEDIQKGWNASKVDVAQVTNKPLKVHYQGTDVGTGLKGERSNMFDLWEANEEESEAEKGGRYINISQNTNSVFYHSFYNYLGSRKAEKVEIPIINRTYSIYQEEEQSVRNEKAKQLNQKIEEANKGFIKSYEGTTDSSDFEASGQEKWSGDYNELIIRQQESTNQNTSINHRRNHSKGWLGHASEVHAKDYSVAKSNDIKADTQDIELVYVESLKEEPSETIQEGADPRSRPRYALPRRRSSLTLTAIPEPGGILPLALSMSIGLVSRRRRSRQ